MTVRNPKDFAWDPESCLSFKGPCPNPTSVYFQGLTTKNTFSCCPTCAEEWQRVSKTYKRMDDGTILPPDIREISFNEFVVWNIMSS